MKNKTTFFLTVLFVLLILGNVYFINAANKASYEILIGKPVIGENGSEAVDFQHSTPLKRKKRYRYHCIFPASRGSRRTTANRTRRRHVDH